MLCGGFSATITGLRLDEQPASFSGHRGRILTKTNNMDYITYSCVVCYITVVLFYSVRDVAQRRGCVMLPLPTK